MGTVDGESVVWSESPAGTDVSLERFLLARKGDVAAAQKMFVSQLEWRARVFPIPREGKVLELIEDGQRFKLLDHDQHGRPVLLVNFLFGNFCTETVTECDLVLASLRFFEDVITEMEARGVYKLCCIAFG